MIQIGKNIIKLEGFGVYVTLIDNVIYTSDITPSGHPTLDRDGCINWDELLDPPNQQFLNLVNAHFGISKTMRSYGKPMSISEIREYSAFKKPEQENLIWLVKNLRERDK
jgi:hypothetical protein